MFRNFTKTIKAVRRYTNTGNLDYSALAAATNYMSRRRILGVTTTGIVITLNLIMLHRERTTTKAESKRGQQQFLDSGFNSFHPKPSSGRDTPAR